MKLRLNDNTSKSQINYLEIVLAAFTSKFSLVILSFISVITSVAIYFGLDTQLSSYPIFIGSIFISFVMLLAIGSLITVITIQDRRRALILGKLKLIETEFFSSVERDISILFE